MDLMRVVRGPRALARWAIATLVANIGIVVTGGLVRLTGSGLGCPTWPKCSADSWVSHTELGMHGAIEFGNRLLTFVLILVAVLTWVSAMVYREHGQPRRDLRRLAAVLALGIPVQAVIGGISVLLDLNPYVVSAHLIASLVLVSLAVWLVRLTWAVPATPVGPKAVGLATAVYAGMWLVVILGTLVTGSGPHAGDANVPRNGLDSMLLTYLHTGAVVAVVIGTLLCIVLLRSRAGFLLLAVEGFQAGIGVAQYNLGLPVGLVALHLLGAALAVAASANLMLSVTRRPAGEAATPPDRVAQPAAARTPGPR